MQKLIKSYCLVAHKVNSNYFALFRTYPQSSSFFIERSIVCEKSGCTFDNGQLAVHNSSSTHWGHKFRVWPSKANIIQFRPPWLCVQVGDYWSFQIDVNRRLNSGFILLDIPGPMRLWIVGSWIGTPTELKLCSSSTKGQYTKECKTIIKIKILVAVVGNYFHIGTRERWMAVFSQYHLCPFFYNTLNTP